MGKIRSKKASSFLINFIIAFGLFSGAMLICILLRLFNSGVEYASMIFILAVFLISRITEGYYYGIFFSVVSVLAVNYLFTYPYFKFQFFLPGYPITIISMLAVSIITSTLTSRVKQNEKDRVEAEKEKTRSNLLRAISHDIRTPLTSIIGASSAILETSEGIDDEKRQLLLGIKEDANWLIRMVENLLSVTRFDSDSKADIIKQNVICEEIIADTLFKFKKRFPNIMTVATVPDKVIIASMDSMLIEQVILNLLENAVYHSQTATQIHISLSEENGQAVFKVEDNGIGIDKNVLPNIFSGTRKFVSCMENDSKKNMGIGLSVCNTIIKAHNGKMKAENLDSGGASFSFTLPLEDADYE